MKYVVDLPGELFSRIRRQLGEHRDLGSFFLLAAENQLALEAGELTLPDDRSPGGARPAGIPEIFRGGAIERAAATAPVGAELSAEIRDAQGVPWLWGQVNRVFPLKCLARAVSKTGPAAMPLDQLKASLADPCRELGLYLLGIDERNDARRDERLSVGFPVGRDRDAAIARFMSLFLGETREDGRVAGALFTLGLAGFDDAGLVALTAEGDTFARLENPVLDVGRVDSVLGTEERRAYLEYTLVGCPGEVAAFGTIASALRDGPGSNSDIEGHMAAGPGGSWTEAVVSTQRSGTMGRMLDLGLLSRSRRGRRVEFELTDSGRDFLSRAEEASGVKFE